MVLAILVVSCHSGHPIVVDHERDMRRREVLTIGDLRGV